MLWTWKIKNLLCLGQRNKVLFFYHLCIHLLLHFDFTYVFMCGFSVGSIDNSNAHLASCLLSRSFRMNPLLHRVQWCGFAPEWVYACFLKLFLSLKRLPHSAHWNAAVFKCAACMWQLREESHLNVLSHQLHWYVDLMCRFWCCLSCWLLLKRSGQNSQKNAHSDVTWQCIVFLWTARFAVVKNILSQMSHKTFKLWTSLMCLARDFSESNFWPQVVHKIGRITRWTVNWCLTHCRAVLNVLLHSAQKVSLLLALFSCFFEWLL